MNKFFRPHGSSGKIFHIFDDKAGAVLTELALVLTPLLLALVIATDYALERLADAQVQNAVVAAANYAATQGCDKGRMQIAANDSMDPNFTWITSKPTLDVIASCYCGLSGQLLPPSVAGDPPTCAGAACVDVAGFPYNASPYATITASQIYDSYLTRLMGQKRIYYSLQVKTFGAGSYDETKCPMSSS
jgi:hypothetical protein